MTNGIPPTGVPENAAPGARRAGETALLNELEQACSVVRAGLQAMAGEDAHRLAAHLSEVEKLADALRATAATAAPAADQDHQAGVPAQERQMHLLRRKLADQTRYAERLSEQVARYKRELAVASDELKVLKASLSFRLGNALVSARNARGLIALPVRLFRLAKEAWPRIAERLKRRMTGGAGDDAPDLGPDIALAGDAADWLSQSGPEATPIARLIVGSDNAPQLPDDLSGLRIATIMDEFSFNAFRHCGEMRQLSSDAWRQEVAEFMPHMLLVESAWKGQAESWARKVYPLSRELVELVGWCRERRIPTVFWNKEDPVHLSVFMRTARQFDFVFTTDIDCVRAYKAALGHDQVYWLPFACQPMEHDPREEYERKDGFCFAGSFYAKYPERQRDFAMLAKAMGALRPFDIYDRNAGKDDPALAFPEEYASMIRGALPYERISLAYKGYRFGVNINTVKQSQSMFARRAFDLLACNTVTVSNFSRGLRLLLGDLVISSDNGDELTRRVRPLLDDASRYRRFRLAGLRKVMSEHTYQDRFRYILEKVTGKSLDTDLPRVVVIGHAADALELERLGEAYARQSYPAKEMVVVCPDGMAQQATCALPAGISVVAQSEAAGESIEARWPGCWLAVFSPHDHYGEHYLTDLCLATRYTPHAVIGKSARHSWRDGRSVLLDEVRAYRAGETVPLRRAIVRIGNARTPGTLASLNPDHACDNAFGIDEFHYCEDGAGQDCSALGDLPGLWSGLPMSRMQAIAEDARAAEDSGRQLASPALDAEALSSILPMGPHADGRVLLGKADGVLRLESRLPGDEHAYLYTAKPLPLKQLLPSQMGKLHFDVDTEMLLSVVLIFLDADRKRIGHAIRACGSNLNISAPANTQFVRFGLRVQGPGQAQIRRLVQGHLPSPIAGIPGKNEWLVITRGYPAYEHLYNYAYVHRRVAGYAQAGVGVDVFRLSEGHIEFNEFEGIDVVSGQLSDLETMIRGNPYRGLMVHSLDRALWSVIREHAGSRQVVVWIHGAEIQPWFRRHFSFFDDRDRERAMERSNDRMAFWREVFSNPPEGVKFVFVSSHLYEETVRDLGIDIDSSRVEIVHNHIDGQLFAYEGKGVEQRKRLLSIRPYSRSTYANDLTVRAILDLVDEPYFGELEFRLVGDGRLLDETVAPVRHLPNVIVDQRFLTQAEIAALHKEYGVFLCPSRIDSQGVSRDEAMASGLVPVTNRVSAIPEFVDEQCAFLADPEDWRGMADAIRRLYREPETFLRMSRAASERVRAQSGYEQTLRRELEIVGAIPPMPGRAAIGRTGREIKSRIALYGDLDINLIDGSAIWAASLAEVLAGMEAVDVDLYVKCPIRNTAVLHGLLGLVNVRLIEPPAGVARWSHEDVIARILAEDVRRGYQAVVMRGLELATHAAATPGLASRLWVYLTDIPHQREALTPEKSQKVQRVAEGAGLLLCQTPQLMQHLIAIAPAATGKTRLLPPMVPDRYVSTAEGTRRMPGQPLRIAYAGKFAPLWGIRELFRLVDGLRREGVPVELHVFGDKIHNPPEDPAFRADVQARLQAGDGLFWHGAMDRAAVLERMRDMHVGWAWRCAELEDNTLELSTKLLEYAACGVPPLLAPGPVNRTLLGSDYPLFATEGSLPELIRALLADDGALEQALGVVGRVVDGFTFSAVRARHVAPLLAGPGIEDGVADPVSSEPAA